jgi:hypothetical protein
MNLYPAGHARTNIQICFTQTQHDGEGDRITNRRTILPTKA